MSDYLIECMSEFIDLTDSSDTKEFSEKDSKIIDFYFNDKEEEDILPYFTKKYNLNTYEEVVSFFKANPFKDEDLRFFLGLKLVR